MIKLLATGLSLCLLLMVVRAFVIGFGYLRIFARAAGQILASYYDLLYAVILTALFLILLRMTQKGSRARRTAYRVYLGVAVFSLLAALANVRLVRMLGRPLNYQWLYYSDFLRSREARDAIFEEFSWSLWLVVCFAIMGLLALTRAFYRVVSVLTRRVGFRRLALAAAVLILIYFPLGGLILARRDWNISLLQNPIVSFAQSIIVAGKSPGLLTMKTTVGAGDFEPPLPRSAAASPIAQRSAGRIRNVLLLVLESVPAEYVEPFGGQYSATPELARARSHSTLFRNIYAHCPETSHSLVSLLLSIYPRISYESITMEEPAIPLPSLSSELKRRGYRTAFFNAADLRYQHCDVFLSYRQFDRIQDYRSVPCDRPLLTPGKTKRLNLTGRDDACVVDSLTDWITEAPDQPHFGVLWTMMTHYPYFSAGGDLNFGAPEKLNRYLNALHHDDDLIGKLLRALQEHHLDKSTLVVVVGDHGEAFGRHDQWSHARAIYEENVHVPLLLINPELFHGEESNVNGGLIDIAPTIMEILGLDPPAAWQGRSLWSDSRSPRVYFFASWSNHLFGLREDDTKMVYNAETNSCEVYDLATDPHETINRAAQVPEATRLWQERIAAWVQYQNRMMESVNKSR